MAHSLGFDELTPDGKPEDAGVSGMFCHEQDLCQLERPENVFLCKRNLEKTLVAVCWSQKIILTGRGMVKVSFPNLIAINSTEAPSES